MNRISSVVLSRSAVVIFTLGAAAQTYGQGPYYQQGDPNYRNDRDRGGYGYNDRYYPQRGYYPGQGQYGYDGYGRNQGSLIGRVMADLNMAASNAHLDGHERKHFDEVARKLEEFEEKWAQGRFDTGKLDGAIHNLEHLADADRVRGRDREILARDMEDLRQLRATRGRYSNNGYGEYRDDRYNQNWRYDPNWR